MTVRLAAAAVSLALVFAGSHHFQKCPAGPEIPIWLVVGGFSLLLLPPLLRFTRLILISSLIFAWLLYGTFLVHNATPRLNLEDKASSDYCSPWLFRFSEFVLAAGYCIVIYLLCSYNTPGEEQSVVPRFSSQSPPVVSSQDEGLRFGRLDSAVTLDDTDIDDLFVISATVYKTPMNLREKFVYQWIFKERETNFYKEGFLHMNELRKKREHCDIILVATGGNGDQRVEIFAHKIVLAVSSPYFTPLFGSGMMESNAEKIEINIDPETLETFVNFMYTAQLTIDEDKVQEMIEAANYFQFDDLVKQCGDYLIGSMDTDCCLQLREFALRYNLSNLEKAALDHVIRNFSQIITTDFTKMSEETLTLAISSDKLRVTKEEVVFQKTMTWVRAEEKRKEALQRLLKHIRFSHMKSDYILTTVVEDPIIEADPQCRKIIRDVNKKLFGKHIDFSGNDNKKRLYYHASACYSFPVSGSQWLPAPSLNEKIKWHATAVLDKKIFCVGGNYGTEELKTVQFLDPITGKWQYVRSLPVALSSLGLTSFGDSLYAVGVLANGEATKVVHVYDVNTDTWREGASTLETRCASVASWNGVLYAAGAAKLKAKNSTAEMWDPRTDAWQQLPPMLTGRSRPQLAAVNGKVFAIGDANGDVNTIEFFDIRAGKWCLHEALLHEESLGYRVTVCNDDIVLSGGTKKGTWEFINQLKILRNDSWIDGPDVLANRSHHALCALDGTLFSLGGWCGQKQATDTVHCIALDIDKF